MMCHRMGLYPMLTIGFGICSENSRSLSPIPPQNSTTFISRSHRWEREMKVVLFCGGMGLRLREFSEHIPKPMVNIGYRPILWHIMKYYAHFGHKEFILCLGYGGDVIKKYFLNYNECISNDFVLSDGGKHLQLFNTDIEDWKITFADTGMHSNIGQR